MRRAWVLAFVVIGVCVQSAYGRSPATLTKADFYVSPAGNNSWSGTLAAPNAERSDGPFATLSRARDAVRQLKKTAADRDITVLIRGGTYYLKETVVFGLEDSGNKNQSIKYAAYPGEEPIFSSGVRITGWKKLKCYPDALPAAARDKVWVADVPETKAGKWRFRTLYDGDKMLPRARSKGFTPTNDCPLPTHAHRWEDLTTLCFPEGLLRNWENLEDVEIFIRPTQQWLVNYLGLASVNEAEKIARTGVPGTYMLAKVKGKDWPETCWVENVLEALDEPGEWALNTQQGKLYLWPKNETPGDNITAPALQELFRIEGRNVGEIKGDVPVRNVVFEGLTFTCGDRDVWTNEDKGIQHDWEMFDKANALLRFRGAQDCAVEKCTFRNSGGTGIRLDLYCRNIRLAGNHIYNLGGTGILLCGYGPGLKDVNKGHTVANNHIHNIGTLYWHNPAVFIWQSGENKILNNYIHDLPYDGIVLSGVRPRFFGVSDPVKWKGYPIPKNLRENMRTIRWNETGNPETAAEALCFAHARNNLVQDNELHHVMQLLGDGNAIYLSCAGTGNVIRRNLIHQSPGAGTEIRFDDDQEESTVSENIIFGSGIKLKHTNYIENNIIIGGGISIRPETAKGARIARNIIYSTGQEVAFYSVNLKRFKLTEVLELANPDYNLFYSDDRQRGRNFLAEVQEAGYDKHSIFADPKFVDLKNGDLRLRPDSPALKLGIKSINIDKIGLADEPAFPRLRRKGFDLFPTQATGADFAHK